MIRESGLNEFIFYYLTYNDTTIWNAVDVFNEIKDTAVSNVGFKDVGLSFEDSGSFER